MRSRESGFTMLQIDKYWPDVRLKLLWGAGPLLGNRAQLFLRLMPAYDRLTVTVVTVLEPITHVFGPPGSGSITQRCGFGSRSGSVDGSLHFYISPTDACIQQTYSYCGYCVGTGYSCFWSSRIRIHYSEVRIRLKIRICWRILTFLKVFHLHSFSLLGRRGRRWRNIHFAGTSPVCVRTKVASGAAINVPRKIGFMTAIEDCNTVEDTGGSIYGIDKRVRIRIHNTYPGSWIQKQHWKPRVKKNFVIKSFILEQ
jgi:hypothetical protein